MHSQTSASQSCETNISQIMASQYNKPARTVIVVNLWLNV